MITTVRGLLLGTPVNDSWLLAVGWCVAFTILGYVWSKALFRAETHPVITAVTAVTATGWRKVHL